MTHIIDRITQEIDAVTDKQVEAIILLDQQEGEEILGNVADYPYIHRVWALAHDYDRQSSLAIHSAKFGGPKNREKLTQEAHWLETLECFVRDLAWLEVRQVLPHALQCESIGMRTGWIVVKANSKRQDMQNLLSSFREALQKAGVGVVIHREEDEEDEEEKVQ